MKYRDITVTIPSKDLETASSIADMLDFGGMYVEDYSDLMENEVVRSVGLVDEELLNRDRSTAKLHIYIDEEMDAEECIQYLSEQLSASGIVPTITVSFIDEEDYTTCWKKYYKPTKIGERIVVVPEWESYSVQDGEIPLYLNPGMAFGTGTHETTSMCLEVLQRLVRPEDTVLDIGCGSGILSIGSLLLGASEVLGCDVDEGAVKVSRENAALNRFDGHYEAALGNILDDGGEIALRLKGKRYDIVVANIVADVILMLAGKIGTYLKPNGFFLTSGIIHPRADEVRRALEENGFTVTEMREKKEWVCFVARK